MIVLNAVDGAGNPYDFTDNSVRTVGRPGECGVNADRG